MGPSRGETDDGAFRGRMELSVMGEWPVPDYAALHPGYEKAD